MQLPVKEEEQRHILRRVSSSLADIVIAQKDPGYTAHRSTCPDGQFWLPVQGVQLVNGQKGFRRQQPFELIYYAPKEPATRVTDSPTIAYGLRLMLSTMTEEERDDSWMQGGQMTWETKRATLQLISYSLNPNSDRHGLDELAARWVARPQKPKHETHQAKWMIQVIDLIQHDPSLSLLDLSRDVGIVPSYLSAQFARVQGKTISAYRRQVMIERVLLSARTENLNVSAIEAGFYDASHFHRICKAELGLKPAQLRELISPT